MSYDQRATHVGRGISRFGSDTQADEPAVDTTAVPAVEPVKISDDDKTRDYVDSEGHRFVLVRNSELVRLRRDKEVEYKDSDGNVYLLDKLGLKKYASRPVTQDQYMKEGMWIEDPPVTEVFDLGDKDQLDAYNELQRLTYPIDGPSVRIAALRQEFYRGKFIMLVTYSKVWYLLPEPK